MNRMYKSVFKEYNLGFYKPKKDQCKKCLSYSTMTEEEKALNKECHDKHINKKNDARKCRDEDKSLAKADTSILAFNSDLEAVLYTPKGSAGQIFYLRKLAVYNFTVYDLVTQDVDCYLWDETQGKRGSNEISTIIFDYVMAHPNITAVRMMSDGCGGQQKNSIVMAMCLQLLLKHPKLQIIDHRFFEPGHTEMECDSIHSKIEVKSKNVPVYVPEGWAQLIRDSRRNPAPYKVHTMTFDDFYDYKTLSENIIAKNKFPIQTICWLHYDKKYPDKIFYKTSFDQEEFTEVAVKKTRGRPKSLSLESLQSNSSNFSTKICRSANDVQGQYHNKRIS
ncbi:uncharacterized protein [Leptinotarsa decemlineata]|uniref:uncharacterized protein n=1 Tax=Leptinotarsa decemlineata TaxID=7539 RepID=UPI003D3076ED